MAKATPKQAHTAKGSRRQPGSAQDDIYRDLLSDAAASGGIVKNERPLKRRRVKVESIEDASLSKSEKDYAQESLNIAKVVHHADAEQASAVNDGSQSLNKVEALAQEGSAEEDLAHSEALEQVVYDESDTSEESDFDWENVLHQDQLAGSHVTETNAREPLVEDMQIELDQPTSANAKRTISQRLPSSNIEKRKRLDLHKVHICALLAQLYARNTWCNDERTHNIFEPALDKRVKSFLNPKPSLSQRDRTTQFIKGLEEASHAWRAKFVISSRGTRKPLWPTTSSQLEAHLNQPEYTSDDRADFMRAAARPTGSRDLGAQLFCALLRSAGVDTRLVCSLQPLSFTSAAPAVTPISQKPTVDLTSSALDAPSNSDTDTSVPARSPSPTPRPIRRFGRSNPSSHTPIDLGKAPASASKRRKIVDSPYPIYWVEAFNAAKQQWIAVDPFATLTVNRPAKLEPPASDPYNDLTYVIAFNADGTARDVTRRYARAYNAKTRKSRVEATEGGQRWFRRAMRIFRLPGSKPDRDAIEDAELDNLEAKEPMPRNVQDFKDHPHYALERHLRRHEVVHPRREVGKLRVGKGEEAVEPVFRRRDVQLCKSADKWYRVGRELKAGEQPLKRVRQRRTRGGSMSPDDEGGEEGETVGLFAMEQTELYVPPPCAGGKVPKNQYKNLDVYVPSMIPPGAVHIRSSDGVAAAKALRVDFAEAVTGFKFKGRRGTAVMRGVVVAREFRDAMEEAAEALRWQRREEDRLKRSRMALGLWKRFLTGLRIRERIMGEAKTEQEATMEGDGSGSEYEGPPQDTEGGFLVEDTEGPAARPTRGKDRDVLKEKFQDDFAEIINEDPGRRAKEYWESTIVSPWDVPGLLGPASKNEQGSTNQSQGLDELFEETQEPGGFLLEDGDDSGRMSNAPGGFLLDGGASEEPEKPHEPIRQAASQQIGGNENRGVPSPSDPTPLLDNSVDFKPALASPTRSVEKQRASSDSEDKDELLQDNVAVSEDDDEVEQQSLLSEDPDDIDAEPEWLADEAGIYSSFPSTPAQTTPPAPAYPPPTSTNKPSKKPTQPQQPPRPPTPSHPDAYEANGYLDGINKHFFKPHGLYAVVMSYKPGDGAASHVVDIGTNTNAAIAAHKGGRAKWHGAAGKAYKEHLPECAPLVFLKLERASYEEKKNAFACAMAFAGDYGDRRKRAEWKTKNPESRSNVRGVAAEFESSLGDPRHKVYKGGVLNLLLGGMAGEMRRERRQMKEERKAERTGKEYRPTREEKRREWMGMEKGDGRSTSEVRSEQREKRREQGLTLVSFVKRQLGENVLYLMIVNMPTEEAMANARETTKKSGIFS